MLDIAQSVSSQVSRILKLQQKEVIFCGQAQLIENCKKKKKKFYRILNQAQAHENV